jgi:molybdopterin/thiamine biosynthesis adenylyltransferase
MADKFHHEQLYRGEEVVRRLGEVRITICGAGALGSNLADTLARQGFRRLRVIDRDRVEAHNVGTQTYGEGDVGAWKADVLRNQLFRACGVELEALKQELIERTAGKLLKGSDLVVDAFDNSASRAQLKAWCQTNGVPCLHAGLFENYGEVIWNERYRVPADVLGDVCDYPLARNLIVLTVAVTAECLVRYVATGAQQDWSITLEDFAVRPLET